MCRFAVGACALQDLAQDAQVKSILAPTPKSVDRNRACRRAYLQRFFEVWRAHTAQHASKSRRACNFPQHLLITSSAQFSGEDGSTCARRLPCFTHSPCMQSLLCRYPSDLQHKQGQRQPVSLVACIAPQHLDTSDDQWRRVNHAQITHHPVQMSCRACHCGEAGRDRHSSWQFPMRIARDWHAAACSHVRL